MFAVTCPQCGSPDSQLVNQSGWQPEQATTEVVGVVACCGCSREWMVDVVLRPMADPEKVRNARKQAKRRKAMA